MQFLRERLLIFVVAGCLLAFVPGIALSTEDQAPQAAQAEQCQSLVTRVTEQNRQLHQELRQIKREMALLNQNLEKPGVREIMSGIGYILGLFGVAALVSGRRRRAKEC
nr:hypothetical protein [uncultured Desulfobulbus sp.]